MTLTLRKKTLIVITLTLITLTVVLFFGIRLIVLGSFEDLEKDDVGRHVQRVNQAIDNELADMNSKLNDWAKPGQELDVRRLASLLDDEKSRASLQRGNNLADLLATLDINVFLWTDSSDKIFWGWAFNEETETLDLVPKSLRGKLTSDSPLLRHSDTETSVTGMILLPENPMLIVSSPILYRVGDGPVENASMIMGKYLDEPEIQRLEDLTRLSLAVHRYDDSGAPADFLSAKAALANTPIFVDPLDGDLVAGYTVLSDIDDAPSLTLRVDVPRDIIEQGNNSMNFLLIALVVVGVVLVVVIAFLLDKLVLSRMASLSTQVGAIDTNADLSTRVSVPGKDELSILGGAINGMLGDIQTERGKSESLLLNVLPKPIAERLKEGAGVIADSFPEVSVLFSDVVGFTKLSARISATELVDMLNGVFSAFDRLTEKYDLEKIKTIGDAYMVCGGLPVPREDHAEALPNMALDMYTELYRLNDEHGTTLDIRIGMHSGPVVAGVIGTKKFIYDLWGDTVNTTARMESHGVPCRVQVTEQTYKLLEGKFSFEDRGIIDVKGKGDMHCYLLGASTAAVGEAAAVAAGD